MPQEFGEFFVLLDPFGLWRGPLARWFTALGDACFQAAVVLDHNGLLVSS